MFLTTLQRPARVLFLTRPLALGVLPTSAEVGGLIIFAVRRKN